MSDLLTDKTAVVTGGASGIGRGISLKLASHDAHIVVSTDCIREFAAPLASVFVIGLIRAWIRG